VTTDFPAPLLTDLHEVIDTRAICSHQPIQRVYASLARLDRSVHVLRGIPLYKRYTVIDYII